MNTTVLNAINEQINSEFEASYTYLAMASFCEQQRFSGAARWLRSRATRSGCTRSSCSTSCSPATAPST